MNKRNIQLPEFNVEEAVESCLDGSIEGDFGRSTTAVPSPTLHGHLHSNHSLWAIMKNYLPTQTCLDRSAWKAVIDVSEP